MSLYLTSTKLQHWLNQPILPCLFLDIDGTLAPFTLDPSQSQISPANLSLIQQLQNRNVPVAIITGRSLAEARKMLILKGNLLNSPMGATHGLEIAFSANDTPVIPKFIQSELPFIIEQIQTQLYQLNLTKLYLEIKPYSVALHYRQYQDLAELAETIMQNVAPHFPNWKLKQGKFVWEILPNNTDKGQAMTAILAYFEQVYHQTFFPIFIGDDVSDEAGFLAVQANNGIGIKVGEPIASTYAKFFIKDLNEVTQILQTIYQYTQHFSSHHEPTL